jgi:2-polyprenyl-3-methyl-5-hydroxy-6-metoxy-1,4-benzoquinol methylase
MARPHSRSDVSTKCYENAGNSAFMALVPSSARSVLDVGCGSGTHARQLQARGMEVDGITISPEEHASAVGHCRNCWIHDLEDGLPSKLGKDV